jgi:hypothetical protein
MQNKVKFKIDGVEYSTPGNVSEITIARFVKYLDKVVNLCPKVLEEVTTLEEEEDTIEKNFDALTDEQRIECFEYFVKVVAFWTGATEQDLHELNLDDLTLAFWTLEYMFGSIVPDPEFVGFEIGGIEYLLPSKHMTKSTLIEFAESAQFQQNVAELKAGNYIAILDVMSVLCRPFGEVYDAANNAARKKLFSSLSLDVALNVGFFLIRLNVGLKKTLSIYSLKARIQAAAQ